MTAAEKDALEWLDHWANQIGDPKGSYAVTIKAMLARPVMPEEPSEEMLEAMRVWPKNAYGVYRALYAHLSAPAPDYYTAVGLRAGVSREVAMAVLHEAAEVSRRHNREVAPCASSTSSSTPGLSASPDKR